jgi:hypothetical protein
LRKWPSVDHETSPAIKSKEHFETMTIKIALYLETAGPDVIKRFSLSNLV